MNFWEKIVATSLIALVGLFGTMIRKYKSVDSDAGAFVIGWTLAIIGTFWILDLIHSMVEK